MNILFNNSKFKEFIELSEKDQEKKQEEEKKIKEAEKKSSLSDETIISGTTWGSLKKNAMEPDYMKKSPFAKYLKKAEKETLK